MDKMFFQFSSNSDPQNTTNTDEILDSVPMAAAGNSSTTSTRGRQGKSKASEKREKCNDDEKKKSSHRVIERQRRQEMSTLYASLRTLLPLPYIKGKRAISDHMNGAVSYIRDLQKRIDELTAKRDELKKVSYDSSGFNQEMSSNEALPSTAVVSQSLDGVEVVLSTGHGARATTLSRVIALLAEEELDVLNCIYTRINGGMIHTIKSKVSYMRGVDVLYLEQKLNEEISSLYWRFFP